MSRKRARNTPKEHKPNEKSQIPVEILREVYAKLEKPKNPAAPKMRRNGIRQG